MYGIYALVSLERIIISSLSALNLVSESEITFDCRAAFEKLFYAPRSRSDIRRYTTFFFLIDYYSRYNNYHRPFILRPFRKRQQQQQQHTLPFLWIFPPFPLPLSLSLPPSSPSSSHLSPLSIFLPRLFPFLVGKVLEGSRKASWRVGNCARAGTHEVRKRLRR